MEQATDGAETAAIDGLVSWRSENISVWFCLRAPGYRLTLWCALGLLVGGAIQVPQLQLQLYLNRHGVFFVASKCYNLRVRHCFHETPEFCKISAKFHNLQKELYRHTLAYSEISEKSVVGIRTTWDIVWGCTCSPRDSRQAAPWDRWSPHHLHQVQSPQTSTDRGL